MKKNREICRGETDVYVHFTIIELGGYGRARAASRTELHPNHPKGPSLFLIF